jgi:VCBS repeat protein
MVLNRSAPPAPRATRSAVAGVRDPGRPASWRPATTAWLRGAVALLILFIAMPAHGFIEALYPLDKVIKESTHIVVAKLRKVDENGQTAVADVTRSLKGKAQFKQILMNIGIGPNHHAEYIIDRLSPGIEVIVFYKHDKKTIASLVHAADMWFQLFATDNRRDRSKVWWRMSHVEIAMGRTYNGKTRDLVRLLPPVLSGKKKAPRPNPRVPRTVLTRRSRRVMPVVSKGKSGGFHRQTVFRHNGGSEVRGISLADVNGDEMLDVVLCRTNGNVLLTGEPDGPRDKSKQLGLAGGSRAAAWADYDADDHPDLITSNFRLFTNAGGKLRDDSKLLAAPRGRNPEGAGWIDYNNDGRPDILVTNGEHGIYLYENTGKKPKWFRDVSTKAGLGPKGLGAGNGDFIIFFDYDTDGRTDFFYNLGGGVLAHNEGNGKFKLDTRSGLKLSSPGYKRGVAVADYDNDGDLDLFVPGPKRAQLFRNNNNDKFTDVIKSAGDLAKTTTASFSAAWGDVNRDGYLDLLVCRPSSTTRLYLGDGKGGFINVSGPTGVEKISKAHAASFADLDNDGDLDCVLQLADRIIVATNDMPAPKGANSLTVRIRARRGLVGATVRVLDTRGRLLGRRDLNGADGCGGQTGPIAHFGLFPGRRLIVAVLSDGRTASTNVKMLGKPIKVTFKEEEFK